MWLCCCYMLVVKLELTLTVCFPSFLNESANIICNSCINYSKTSTLLKALILKLVSTLSPENKQNFTVLCLKNKVKNYKQFK